MHIDGDLAAAPAAPLVLMILSEGGRHGYAILKGVRELSGDEPGWTDGMLYPLLHRLRRLGYVTTEWRTPLRGRRRRYYVITDDGRATTRHRQRWNIVRALGDVWRVLTGVLVALAERDGWSAIASLAAPWCPWSSSTRSSWRRAPSLSARHSSSSG